MPALWLLDQTVCLILLGSGLCNQYCFADFVEGFGSADPVRWGFLHLVQGFVARLLERFDPMVQVVGHVDGVLGALEKGCFDPFRRVLVLVAKI